MGRGLVWLIAAAVASTAAPALAASYYVNDASITGDLTGAPWCATSVPGADVAGCGTCAAPCGTLKGLFATNTPGPGDTVYVNTGSYLSGNNTAYPTISNSGAAGSPLTLQGAMDSTGAPLAVLDANKKGDACIWLHNATNVVVRGFKCINTSGPTGAPYGSGIFIDGTATDITLSELVIAIGAQAGNSAAGVDIESNPGGSSSSPPPPIAGTITVANSDIGLGQYGVAVVARVANVVIDSNSIHDGAHSAVYLKPGGTAGVLTGQDPVAATVTHNVLFNNVNTNGCASAITVMGYPGVTADGNLIYDNGCNAFDVECLSASFGANTSCVSFPDALAISGNTIHQDQTKSTTSSSVGEVGLFGCNPSGVLPRLRDNIVFQDTTAAGRVALYVAASCTGLSSDYNDWFFSGTGAIANWNGTSYATLSAYAAATGQDAHSISADPLFVDATNASLTARNYRERSQAGSWSGSLWVFDASATSPAIDAADPASAYTLEPFCSGGRRNLGAFGDTTTASKSVNTCGLSFATAAQTVDAGACSGVVTVEATDVGGAFDSSAGTLSISLASAPAGLGFYLDAACTQSASSVNTAGGAASFYFLGSSPGTFSVNASSVALQSASQSETLVAPATSSSSGSSGASTGSSSGSSSSSSASSGSSAGSSGSGSSGSSSATGSSSGSTSGTASSSSGSASSTSGSASSSSGSASSSSGGSTSGSAVGTFDATLTASVARVVPGDEVAFSATFTPRVGPGQGLASMKLTLDGMALVPGSVTGASAPDASGAIAVNADGSAPVVVGFRTTTVHRTASDPDYAATAQLVDASGVALSNAAAASIKPWPAFRPSRVGCGCDGAGGDLLLPFAFASLLALRRRRR